MEAVQTPDSLLQVDPPLRELVLRMLSLRPEERGSVAQLVEDLEQAASAGTKKPTPVEPSREAVPAASNAPPVQPRPWWPQFAVAASALALAVSAVWIGVARWPEQISSARVAATRTDEADGGTAGLGESAIAEPTPDTPEPSLQEAMAEETPPEPFPDQKRPDANGHCPQKRQVALNGGCWLPLEPEACEALDSSGSKWQLFKGRCYVPVLSHPRHRPSTSHPSPNLQK
jgi:hypothetical protein